MSTDGSERSTREYPSVAHLSDSTLLVADGYGTLYALYIDPSNASSTVKGIYELPIESNVTKPFRIHSVATSGEYTGLLLLSSASRQPFSGSSATPASTLSRRSSVVFDIYAVRLDLSSTSSEDSVSAFNICWCLRGQDAPLYVAYEPARDAFLLVGSAPYLAIDGPKQDEHKPAPNEPAPTSREGEALDGSASANPDRPPPYAWTQDDEEVTIALPLPSSTTKGSIAVLFSPQSLSLHVAGAPDDVPRYSASRFWAGISPASCFWTWDASDTARYGLLTLHVEKQHAHTRWPSIFDASAGQPDVPETLDPSALANIREALEKFTVSTADTDAIPSLAKGERDDEADAEVGSTAVLTWAAASDGCMPDWATDDADGTLNVLTTPLPGTHAGPGVSLVVKHTIDGLLFTHAADQPMWTHTATYSALAFVLASKRDTRFIHHVPGRGVIALEGGAGEYGGNAYIYRDSPQTALWAKQAILRAGGGASGALLGVCGICIGGINAVVCLCERELVILRDVL